MKEKNTYTEHRIQEAIKFFDNHFNLILGSEENANILKRWISLNVQRPGIPIGWMPGIVAPSGVGKTAIFELIIELLGQKKHSYITSNCVNRGFNYWLENCDIVHLYIEYRDENPKFFANIKKLLEDDYVSIKKKNGKIERIVNVVNYIGFSDKVEVERKRDGGCIRWLVGCSVNPIKEDVRREHFKSFFHFLKDKEVMNGVREYYQNLKPIFTSPQNYVPKEMPNEEYDKWKEINDEKWDRFFEREKKNRNVYMEDIAEVRIEYRNNFTEELNYRNVVVYNLLLGGIRIFTFESIEMKFLEKARDYAKFFKLPLYNEKGELVDDYSEKDGGSVTDFENKN